MNRRTLLPVLSLTTFMLLLMGCGGDTGSPPTPTPSSKAGYGINIEIRDIPSRWSLLEPFFPKYVDVFGVNVFAPEETSNDKVMHAANVLAQYLDNNADGEADNQRVLDELINGNASLIMAESYDQMESMMEDVPDEIHELFDNTMGSQELNGDETNPGYRFDASLEEVLHLITQHGYAKAYPDVFGEHYNSQIANYMDIARGGRFVRVPSSYPSSAWYSYDDYTCDYSCMVTEYFYWALTSLLGAQMDPDRCEEIEHEWKLCLPQQVRDIDSNIYGLLTDEQYALPSVLPDGNYDPIE